MPTSQITFTRCGLSRKAVNDAGDLMRDYLDDAAIEFGPSQADAMQAIGLYRREFQDPLTRVVMGLRSMVSTEGAPTVVGQRLKRRPQILVKLLRFPGMDLANMQDIGGCRAILPDQATVTRVHRRIMKNRWDVRALDDYVATPKPTGYRALHLVVKRSGRLIEIQLRTPSQHEWAEEVERIDLRRMHGLKDGHGPEELVRVLERSAYAMEQVSTGNTLDPDFDREFDALRRAAQPHL